MICLSVITKWFKIYTNTVLEADQQAINKYMNKYNKKYMTSNNLTKICH